MAENTPSTEELLAQCDQAGSDVLASAVGDWKPPDGTYTGCIESITVRPWKNQKDGVMYPVFSGLIRVLDGPEQGKKFEQAWFGNSKMDMGSLKTLYTLVFGQDPPDVMREFREKLLGIKDTTVEMVAKRTKSRTTGDTFFGLGFTRVIS
jgi:hypothetical protein